MNKVLRSAGRRVTFFVVVVVECVVCLVVFWRKANNMPPRVLIAFVALHVVPTLGFSSHSPLALRSRSPRYKTLLRPTSLRAESPLDLDGGNPYDLSEDDDWNSRAATKKKVLPVLVATKP
jgi:hypothetical protein